MWGWHYWGFPAAMLGLESVPLHEDLYYKYLCPPKEKYKSAPKTVFI